MLALTGEEWHGDSGLCRNDGGDVPAVDRGEETDVCRDGHSAGDRRGGSQEARRQAKAADSGDAAAGDAGVLAGIPHISPHWAQLWSQREYGLSQQPLVQGHADHERGIHAAGEEGSRQE